MAWTNEQKMAIEKSGTNIIVSAGAGSGKTAVLTERVIEKVKNGVHINELLILTFTKAAAGEMKERIGLSLKENGLYDELNLIDSAYITTFDSYALSIVKKYHYLLNISNNINIADASLVNMKKEEIMQELMEEYYSKDNKLFNKLITDFCTRNDDNIIKYLLGMASKLEMKINNVDFLDSYVDNFYSDEYLDKYIKEFENIIVNKVNNLKIKVDNSSMYFDGKYYNAMYDTLSSFFTVSSIDELTHYITISLPKLPRGSEEITKTVKDEISKEIKDILSLLEYGTKEEIKNNILKTKDYVSIIVELLKEYLIRINKYKLENEMYEFNDIAIFAIKILEENENIKDEVKYSLNEIMVDEYQDTNDIQETFISLIENKNVYMVGDIKQSIYRFRNANPYIFKNKYDKYSKLDGGIKIDLLKNFRSRDEVLSNINSIFDHVMDDYLGGAKYFESHRMVFGNDTYINEGKTSQDYNLDVIEYPYNRDTKFTKEEIEIFYVAKDIKDKVDNKYQVFDKKLKVLRDITYNDFVILMDRTSSFDLYKKIFEYVEIPLTLYKDETLNSGEELSIINNIIELIIHLNNKKCDNRFKYLFTSIGRSFLFEYTDQEIFDCILNNDFKNNTIYELFNNINIDNITPKELLELIIEKTNYYENMIKVGDINNRTIRLQKIIELSVNLSSYGYNIYMFNDYLNKLITEGYEIKYSVSTDNNNSVKIMTIHKSKGLEYHICYFTGLYKTFNISDIKERFIYSNKYGIITPYFEEGICDTINKYLLKEDYYKEEISEKIRLFYVALTRAKEKMIMLIPSKEDYDIPTDMDGVLINNERMKYRSFADILYSIKKYLKKYYKEIDIDSLNISKDYIYNKDRILNDNDKKEDFNVIPFINNSNIIEHLTFSKKTNKLITKEERKNMKFGTNVHEILEHVDFKNYIDIEDEYINRKIKSLLNHEIMSNLDSANIYKEYEFIYIKDNIEYHGIIDLMVEYEDHINIIDYKLKNVDSEAYINQLNGYKEYISSKTNKVVNIYLYSIIDETLKEL